MSENLEYLPSIRLRLASAEAHAQGDYKTAGELAHASREAEKSEWEEFYARQRGSGFEREH